MASDTLVAVHVAEPCFRADSPCRTEQSDQQPSTPDVSRPCTVFDAAGPEGVLPVRRPSRDDESAGEDAVEGANPEIPSDTCEEDPASPEQDGMAPAGGFIGLKTLDDLSWVAMRSCRSRTQACFEFAMPRTSFRNVDVAA